MMVRRRTGKQDHIFGRCSMKKTRGGCLRWTVFMAALLLGTLMCAMAAFAENAGWNTENGKYYYNMTTESGFVRAKMR